ncbi:MAG: hypothetical protein WBG71_10370 [Leeuwenhoekiella sp.]
MKDNLYYQYNPEKRNVFFELYGARHNYILGFFVAFFMLFASNASAIVEVFLRRNFGERYITLAQSIGLFFILIVSSFWAAGMAKLMGAAISTTIYGIVLSLIFALAFLVMSIIHRLEINKYGTTYDFKRFSLSNGDPIPFLKQIIGRDLWGFKITQYRYNLFVEPAIPFLIGIVLCLTVVFLPLGILLAFCGFIFFIRNFAIAQGARNFVLDIIDKKISSESQHDLIVNRKPPSETKGVYLPIELPEDKATRMAIYRATKQSTETDNDIWENDNLDD